jgi:hypothetical protein
LKYPGPLTGFSPARASANLTAFSASSATVPGRPATGARAVLAQRDVDAKTNEITQVKPLLDDVDITGALVTADALHVQRDTTRYLVEQKEADYLFTAVTSTSPACSPPSTPWPGRTPRSSTS